MKDEAMEETWRWKHEVSADWNHDPDVMFETLSRYQAEQMRLHPERPYLVLEGGDWEHRGKEEES